MKLIFFGTPDYVLPVLDALKDAGYEIAAVVTQPPKLVGRKQVLTSSPVAQWAEKHAVAVIDKPPKEISPLLSTIHPQPRLGVLAAYGRLVPDEIIKCFPLGILNIHPSLLPKYRGASPVEGALAAGEKQTGVTIIRLDAELDHGPILTQFTEPILPDDTRTTLRERLFKKGDDELIKILPDYIEKRLTPHEQDHDKATFTTLMKKEHGFIPPEYLTAASQGETLQEEWGIPFVKNLTIHPSPDTIHNFIRAVNPWPGAWTEVNLGSRSVGTRKLKILKAHTEKLVPSAQCLVPDLVQLEGKNPVTLEQFKRGYPKAKLC